MTESLGVMHGQIVRIAFPRNQHVDEESAIILTAGLPAPGSLRPVAVLLDVTGVASVSRAARVVFSNVSSVVAWALHGQTPVDRILAHFILGAQFKSGPAGYFTSEAEALSWLEERAYVR
jgi:hypothetical protein